MAFTRQIVIGQSGGGGEIVRLSGFDLCDVIGHEKEASKQAAPFCRDLVMN